MHSSELGPARTDWNAGRPVRPHPRRWERARIPPLRVHVRSTPALTGADSAGRDSDGTCSTLTSSSPVIGASNVAGTAASNALSTVPACPRLQRGVSRCQWDSAWEPIRMHLKYTRFIKGLLELYGGEGGIRTPGPPEGTADFESAPFGHSGTSPDAERAPRARGGIVGNQRPHGNVPVRSRRLPRLQPAAPRPGPCASITTLVPASTRSNRSMTSSFLMRMQPWEPGVAISTSSGQPWM